MNLKPFFLVVLLLCAQYCLTAQSLLWEISGNDLKESSYLYGTMHVQQKEAFVMTDVLYEKLASVDAFATEVILTEEDEENLVNVFNLPEGKTIKDVLKKQDYKLISKVFKERTGVDVDVLEGISPAGLMFVEMEFRMKKDYPYTVDDYLQKVSENQDKKILAVEDIETQVALMKYMTDEIAIDYFKNPEEADQYEVKMRKLYAEGNIDGLAQMFYEDPRYIGLADAFITKRNYDMTESIIKMMNDQTSFVAVGSGHLGGKEGIVTLLKNKGYTLTPLSGEVVGYRSELVNKAEEWSLFEPDGIPFSFELPTEEIKSEVQELETPEGEKVQLSMLGHEPTDEDSPVKIYMVTHNKTFRGENSETSTKEELKAFFDESQKGSEGRYGQPFESAEDIAYQGYPGRAYKASLMGGMIQVYMRTILAKDSFIIMQIIESSDAQVKREKFFNSLIINK